MTIHKMGTRRSKVLQKIREHKGKIPLLMIFGLIGYAAYQDYTIRKLSRELDWNRKVAACMFDNACRSRIDMLNLGTQKQEIGDLVWKYDIEQIIAKSPDVWQKIGDRRRSEILKKMDNIK